MQMIICNLPKMKNKFLTTFLQGNYWDRYENLTIHHIVGLEEGFSRFSVYMQLGLPEQLLASQWQDCN